MKKTTKGIAVGAVAICLLAGMAESPKKAESLELSIPLYQDEYDINTEIPIEISVSPDDSDIDDLEYFSDSSAVSFTDSVINTGNSEGDYSFYVRSGDVESNILSIHVVDISARNEATRKAEEERLSKEAEEKKAAEEQAAREAEEKTAAEQAAREAEEKAVAEQAAREAEEKAAAEQAAHEAEEKAAAEQAAREAEEQKAAEEQAAKEIAKKTAAEQPKAEPVSAPQPAEEPVQIVEEQVQEVPVSGTAYLSATGEKYHSIDHCGRMNPNKARKTTIAEAEAAGYERCSKCW